MSAFPLSAAVRMPAGIPAAVRAEAAGSLENRLWWWWTD